ncbi:redox-regulated ATPase YchF [Candidatus Berkelbacteria bacterium]|nr:redox-regulated ATPase YchF [Candidatus Berkelbacteria bacterium]OIP06740.1 MAG: redox-regulated ATPase YchF [Candidatus Berkelbacteria bacterium CG2_30_43_20]PIU86970.1 MAG: redox-regulated ATPase YchF [Candidatus Berkelbacteria bacterium CG06_land_8_20_14_3_00_43_10]
MSLKVGIVGLPNVGKSTLFNALLGRAKAQAENRPFTTIEPNVGIVDVPDERLFRLHEIICSSSQKSKVKSQSLSRVPPRDDNAKINNENQDLRTKIVPATIEFVDIAGLVRGAHRGEGLGNQFLSHIREVDALVHVVRFFEDANVIHVENNVNPHNDFETIEVELILADLATVAKLIAGTAKDARSNDSSVSKGGKARLAALQKVEAGLTSQKPARDIELTHEEHDIVKHDQFLTAKPILVVANVSESQLTEADELCDTFLPGADVVALCAKVEAELVDLEPDDAQAYLEDIGQSEPGLNKVIQIAYELLNLRTFFTAGPIEVKAWTIPAGATAPQAAGVIHGDFEKGFIKAEVIGYHDYLEYNGEAGAKQAGKLRLEGKDYIVADGDVCHFRFNV